MARDESARCRYKIAIREKGWWSREVRQNLNLFPSACLGHRITARRVSLIGDAAWVGAGKRTPVVRRRKQRSVPSHSATPRHARVWLAYDHCFFFFIRLSTGRVRLAVQADITASCTCGTPTRIIDLLFPWQPRAKGLWVADKVTAHRHSRYGRHQSRDSKLGSIGPPVATFPPTPALFSPKHTHS